MMIDSQNMNKNMQSINEIILISFVFNFLNGLEDLETSRRIRD